MLFGHLLTNAAQIFADVSTYWSPESVERVTREKLTGYAQYGVIHLINSGPASLDGTGQQTIGELPAMKPFWDITGDEMEKCLKATAWCPAVDFFRGGGYSTDFTTRGGMPVTMARINLIKGVGPVLQLAEGYTVELPDHIHEKSVMNNWGSNHAALSYGHIGSDLITQASMLLIPVCMHNVPDDKVFRPSAWVAFGVMEPVGADFRACANFGPIYGR